jgi:Protein of unknown function (DUF2637)
MAAEGLALAVAGVDEHEGGGAAELLGAGVRRWGSHGGLSVGGTAGAGRGRRRARDPQKRERCGQGPARERHPATRPLAIKGPDAGPEGVPSDIEDRGDESVWRSSNGAAPPSGHRATSEGPQDHEAPTEGAATVRGITTSAVLAVAVVAAVASYDHQRALAALAGGGWRAWLLPVSVDGLVVAASMSMLVRRRAGVPAGSLAWASLLAGIGASLAANVAAADPTAIGRLVAAWPPVALLLAWELLMQVRSPSVAGDRSTRVRAADGSADLSGQGRKVGLELERH